MKITKLVFIVSAILLLSSCAAIIKGSSETVQFDSNPPGATVYVNGQEVATTPGKIKLKSDGSYNVELKHKNYGTPYRKQLNGGVSAGYVIMDIFFTGILGLVIDGASGSWNTLDSDEVYWDFKGKSTTWGETSGNIDQAPAPIKETPKQNKKKKK